MRCRHTTRQVPIYLFFSKRHAPILHFLRMFGQFNFSLSLPSVRGAGKMLLMWACALCLWAKSSKVFAQIDTTQTLQEVHLQGFSLREYAIGTKHIAIDSLAYGQSTGQTLAQTLMEQTGIYLKQYGASGIASVSFRGTGAGHTAVLWNGLPINSFTLGELDFNNVPLANTSQIIVSHGAGGSIFGSGSVGGSIQLLSGLPTEAQNGLSGQFWQGSFGNLGGNLAYQTRQKRWAIRQNIFTQTAKNDFSFVNIAKFDKPTERQQNAENTYKGIQTDLYFFPHQKHTLALHLWLQARENEFSPTMGANLQTHLYTQARERNLRLLANWKFEGLELKMGYLHDFYLYNRTDSTQTQTLLATAQYKTRLTHNLQLRINSNHIFITAFADNYADTKQETRQEISAGLHYQPLERLSIALNVAQMWVDAKNVPFTPSLGAEYRAGKAWFIKGYAGKTYRVPTLNDRFWANGGNPFLRSENGLTTEVGLLFAPKYKKIQLQVEVTPYLLWVRDWILWTPTGAFWSPQNLRSVQARGVEVQASASVKRTRWQASSGLAYAYTRSHTEAKQLAYTPLHRASMWLHTSYKTWFIYQNVSFTSFRYTTLDNTTFLPAFALWNVSVGKPLQVAKQKFTLQFRLNNLLNTAYQNYENRAMPLRSYQMTLNWQIK